MYSFSNSYAVTENENAIEISNKDLLILNENEAIPLLESRKIFFI